MDKHTVSPYPLRLDPELMQWAKEEAVNDDRSLNAQINRWLKQIRESKAKGEGASHG